MAMKQLDPKAVWLFFISNFFSLFFIFLILGFYLLAFISSLNLGISFVVVIGIILLLIFPFTAFIMAKLSYKYYFYSLTEDGFRKEYGIIWKKYVTIPYDRIQNIDMLRGPVARILGLSDLQIQTAGASAQVTRHGVFGAGAEGRLPGLSKDIAEKLRDELLQKVRTSKNQGL